MVLQQIAAYVLLWFEGLVMSWSWTWSWTSLMDAHGDMSCHFALMKTFISNIFIRITWWGTSMNIPSLQVIPVVLAFFVGLRICEQRGLPRRGWQHRITSSLQVMRSLHGPNHPKNALPFLGFLENHVVWYSTSWFRTLAAFGWAANISFSISLISDHGICEATMALRGKQRFQFPAVQGQPWMSSSQSVTSCWKRMNGRWAWAWWPPRVIAKKVNKTEQQGKHPKTKKSG